MVNVVDGILFFYIFVGLYMMSLFVFIYFPNKRRLFDYPKDVKEEGVSIVMPCYNEGKLVGKAIESLLKLDWPKNKIEIIIVDDKSTDDSVKVIRKYEKKYKNVRLLVMSKNSGCAAIPTNRGVKLAKYDYVAVTDADSAPRPDAIRKMIGFLQQDKKVGGVTCQVLARSPRKFIQRLQTIEYAVIAFNRKLLDLIDAVYVTPGPFALYRKKTLLKVGLFDPKNMTQDIEIVWRLISRGYRARMCLDTRVYSETPEKFWAWWRQRIRWNIGGTQTLWKYKGFIFRRGMLGAFIIPFFSLSLFIGIFGFGLLIYLLAQRFLVSYLSTKYSIYAGTAILSLQDLSFAPSVLNFFGAVSFFLGLAFTIFCLSVIGQKHLYKGNWWNLGFYLVVYLSIYPLIMINGLFRLLIRKYSW